jgi:hypothetical protein
METLSIKNIISRGCGRDVVLLSLSLPLMRYYETPGDSPPRRTAVPALNSEEPRRANPAGGRYSAWPPF